jgi:vacuolar-type H+-ATPase subunit C/Vma6
MKAQNIAQLSSTPVLVEHAINNIMNNNYRERLKSVPNKSEQSLPNYSKLGK